MCPILNTFLLYKDSLIFPVHTLGSFKWSPGTIWGGWGEVRKEVPARQNKREEEKNPPEERNRKGEKKDVSVHGAPGISFSPSAFPANELWKKGIVISVL